jgi:hypothetical protein
MDLERRMALGLAGKHELNLDGMRTKVNIMGDCEIVKETLTEFPVTEFKFTANRDSDDRIVKVKLQDLLDISDEQNNTLENVTERAFNESRLTKVDRVEVIGGSVRVPFVQEAIRRVFNVTELHWSLDTDGAAALGAAYVAARNSREFEVDPIEKVSKLTAQVVLLTRGQTYNLFAEGNADNTVRTITLAAKKGQAFVIATDQQKAYFQKFTLPLKGNFFKAQEENVTLTFIINEYILPVLANVTLDDGSVIAPSYETVGWELTDAAVQKAKERIAMLIDFQRSRTERELARDELVALLAKVQRFTGNTNLEPAQKDNIIALVQTHSGWLRNLKQTPAPAADYAARTAAIHQATDQIVRSVDETQSVHFAKLSAALGRGEELVEEAAALPGIDMEVRDDAVRFIGDALQWFNDRGEEANEAELKERRKALKNKLRALADAIDAAKEETNGEAGESG